MNVALRICRASGLGGPAVLAMAAAMFWWGCSPSPAGRHQGRILASAAGSAVVDLSGQRINPFAANARVIVFVFISNECPICNRYAPEIQRLQRQFAPRGVVFWLVHPDATETVAAIRQHTKDYGFTCGVLRDPRHELVEKTGARITPEAAVYLPTGHLVYHGRIDDRWADFGRERPAPTQHDLQRTLEAVLDGKPVPAATQPAVGCYIADLPVRR